jgi:ppGpp synthetase/RelA/SpoT-type nucleotidyltranferase
MPLRPDDKTSPEKKASDETRAYEQAEALAKHIVVAISQQVESALAKLGDPHLIRGKLVSHRIKKPESLRRKAAELKWTFVEALTKARDMVGFRIVCNNLQDVRRASKLLSTELREKGYTVDIFDYIKKPREGYRAIHLCFPVPVQVGTAKMTLICEVQIRSLLQNTWAELSRVDFYRGSVPPAIISSMEKLSEKLYAADKAADKLRSRITKPRRGSKPADGTIINESAIAFLFRDAFGNDPPDYLVQSTLRELEGTPIRSDGLAAVLDDKDFLERLGKEYREANRLDFDADPVLLFRWAVDAAINGRDFALREAKRDGREAWRETDSIYRREALSDLPDVDDLPDYEHNALDDGDMDYDLTHWAEALDASQSCMCGTKIIDEYAFADAYIKRKRLRGNKAERARAAIISMIVDSGVETGSSGMCSYCSHMMDKD